MSGAARRVTLFPLIAATYFMVSGGPYGLEELVASAGYGRALLVLAVTPIVWSLPTALAVGELASAIPEEGGYYAWVRRAMGPFWGFQEAWLSLAASVFDMAIYPTLFTLYLARLVPAAGEGRAPMVLGAAMIFACAAWNARGARAVGGSALVMTVLLLAPFVALSALALLHPHAAAAPAAARPREGGSLLAGILVAMWNYMGWDNASTIAGEVSRPQRTYPLAMIGAVVLVTLGYLVPVYAVSTSGLDPSAWTTGGWVDVAEAIAGEPLATAVVLGGVVCGVGMFNVLVLSYSRLPMVLAEDGYLPAVLARRYGPGDVPIPALALCAVAYTACLGLGFQRLVEIDVLLYGLSLFLELAALVALRVREPDLPRPFRLPGGTAGAVAIGVPPMALLAVAVVNGRHEQAGSVSALAVGGAVIAAGPALYAIASRSRREKGRVRAPADAA